MKWTLFITLISLFGLPRSEGQVSKIWSIAIGHDWGLHEYIDSEGYLKGFGHDLIDKVCMESNMDCRVVWDIYNRCWSSNPGEHQTGGRGLFARWYDACTSWVPTVLRIHVFQFTESHFMGGSSHLYTLKGKEFDVTDLRGRNVGLLNGWADNEKCLARQSNVQYEFSDQNTKFYENPRDIFEALQKFDIDVVFTGDGTWNADNYDLLKKFDAPYYCSLGGSAMMSRKDSGFTAAWNVGFAKLRDTNKYTKFCEETNKRHEAKGGAFICIDS